MSAKKRSFDPQPLRNVLKDMTAQPKIKKGLNQIRVQEAWKNTMGHNVVQYTQSIQLRGEILHVVLSSSALTEELRYGQKKILAHLNHALGSEEIKKIVLR